QVADRWHLFKNLGDVVERVVNGWSLPPVTVEVQAEPASFTMPGGPRRMSRKEAERQAKQQRRQARYDEMHSLYEKTKSIGVAAIQLVLDRRTVRRYMITPEGAPPKRRGRRASVLTGTAWAETKPATV